MTRQQQRTRLAQTQRLALTPALRQSLDVLRMSADDLTRLIEAEAAVNPWLRHTARRRPGPDTLPGTIAAPAPGLYAHVAAQIDAAFPADGRARMLALALADALEPSGWLGTPVAELARATGAREGEVMEVLRRLWTFEPPGLFARTLAECLRLQAQEAGALSPAMQAVLDRLATLARGDLQAIAQDSRLPLAEIAAAARVLRGFDPKPGAQFDADPVQYGTPELLAARSETGWHAQLNPDATARIDLVAGADPEDARAKSAAGLVAMIQRRQATLLAIANAVLAAQPNAFDAAGPSLRPLRLAAIAEATGFSVSTVSRALADTRIITPHGTWPMTAFFPSALKGEVSSLSAKAALRRLIDSEDPAAPLTDAALTDALARDGIEVSRRTVAKYREALGLGPAHVRRRSAPMPR